jgi:hypothetical protein
MHYGVDTQRKAWQGRGDLRAKLRRSVSGCKLHCYQAFGGDEEPKLREVTELACCLVDRIWHKVSKQIDLVNVRYGWIIGHWGIWIFPLHTQRHCSIRRGFNHKNSWEEMRFNASIHNASYLPFRRHYNAKQSKSRETRCMQYNPWRVIFEARRSLEL